VCNSISWCRLNGDSRAMAGGERGSADHVIRCTETLLSKSFSARLPSMTSVITVMVGDKSGRSRSAAQAARALARCRRDGGCCALMTSERDLCRCCRRRCCCCCAAVYCRCALPAALAAAQQTRARGSTLPLSPLRPAGQAAAAAGQVSTATVTTA